MDYDVVAIGGGMAGAALAQVLARQGLRVLVVERETKFRDRVRGEALMAWGVETARELGLLDLLRQTCGHELRRWQTWLGPTQVGERDMVATTPFEQPIVSFYHPAMEEVLLGAAAEAGAEIWRGARVTALTPGHPARVDVMRDGTPTTVQARIVAGCDGRGSAVRRWVGFEAHDDPDRLYFAGILLDGVPADDGAARMVLNPFESRIAFFFPQGGGRVRSYVGWHKDAGVKRLQGEADVPRFFAEATRTGIPEELFAGARAAGPLATFAGADSWVDNPYRDGVALVGDAASTSDPTWGQGMAYTLLGVRLLRDALAATDDWHAAGRRYAAEHERHRAVMHAVEGWYADLFLEPGAAADRARERALPKIAAEPMRIPDHPHVGPGLAADETARRRFFGED
jgi:2-polyprenyl-6-methoxyphenol hydroxylase-like FAD-dependent oxidoreductase